MLPVLRYQGKGFPSDRLSSVFALPVAWSAFIALRDLYFWFTGRAIL
jgi:hypothetical protein